ncbi:MAG: hypothetical protein AB7G87_05965 [Clostridia bacterium]
MIKNKLWRNTNYIMKEGVIMADINEIAQKLNLTTEQVSKSHSLQQTYDEIKNNSDIAQPDKEAAYAEMSRIFKGMLQK